MSESDYFRRKAEQCRRLAAAVLDEASVTALRALAEEFDAKADAAGDMIQPERQGETAAD